jgi:hypothetical protein
MRLKWSRNHEHSGAEGCHAERAVAQFSRDRCPINAPIP